MPLNGIVFSSMFYVEYFIMKLLNIPKSSILALCLYSNLGLSDELDYSFLYGTDIVPSILATNNTYPAGEYYVDVILNDEAKGKTEFVISHEEEKLNFLCLNSQLLQKMNIFFNLSNYENQFDKENNCYRLGDEPYSKIDFDYGAQTLKITIPQAYLLSKTHPSLWDYGTPALRLTYSGNFNKNSHDKLNAFGNFDLGGNLGGWFLSSNMNIDKSDYDHQFSTNSLTLSTPISQLKGDFILGKSETQTNIFPSFNFYGATLRSNSNMRPWDARGYAPVISGIATSQSRITVKQGGYTIYSNVIPSGPYQLKDISPVSNGNLVVTVEDDSGHKTESVYPVSTLPSLLRPKELEYNFAIGQKNNDTALKEAFSSGNGFFGLASVNYGLNNSTINSGIILHNQYQSAGLGLTYSLGFWGAVETNFIAAKARYDNDEVKTGSSIIVKYAKSLTEDTNIQLLTYRHQSQNFVDFSSFDAKKSERYDNQKSRYEARLSHRFNRSYLNASYWQQDYWLYSGFSKGVSASVGTMFDFVSASLNGTYSERPFPSKPDYSLSLSMSVPLNIGSDRFYITNSTGYNRDGVIHFNSGVSTIVNDRFNYSINTSIDSVGNNGATGSASYAFDMAQTNFSLSQDQYQTSLSGGISGSLVATSETGLLLTKETSKTIGIVNIDGLEGVTVNQSLPTNSQGNTVLPLSEYSHNTILVNMDNVPDNVELLSSSLAVVPTEHAVIYRQFEVEHIKRYLLVVKNPQGKKLTGGNAVTEQGLNAGFISNQGLLVMNMLAEPKGISIETGEGTQCHFSMQGLKANTNKVQVVSCL